MYDKYIQELKDICEKKRFPLEAFGRAGKRGEYALWSIVINKKSKNKKTVLFTAGIHGDETSGPLAILEFLKKFKVFASMPKIIILPVLNPFGFDKNKHENHKRLNLNRHFLDKNPMPAENLRIYDKIKNEKLYFAASFHEDDIKRGVYIYGHVYGKNSKPAFFYDILMEVKRYNRLCLDKKIYGEKAVKGLIPKVSRDGSLEEKLNAEKVPYVACVEQPDKIPIKKRIKINTVIMKKIISLCGKGK